MNTIIEAISSSQFGANFIIIFTVIFGFIAAGLAIAGACAVVYITWCKLEDRFGELYAWLSSIVLVPFFASLFFSTLVTFLPPGGGQ